MDIMAGFIIAGVAIIINAFCIKLFIVDYLTDKVLDNKLITKQRDHYLEMVRNYQKMINGYQDKIRNYKKLVTEQQATIKKYKNKNRNKAKQIENLQQSLKNHKYQVQALKDKRDKLKEQNTKLLAENMRLTLKLNPDKYYDEITKTLEKMNKEDCDPYLLDKRKL